MSGGKEERRRRGLVLHGVLKERFLADSAGAAAVLVFRVDGKENGHGTKTKSIATGVGVQCCIEFGLDAQNEGGWGVGGVTGTHRDDVLLGV